MSPLKGYKPTIGLEIHTELKTRTKMFCNSRNSSEEEEPNTHICPVCLAHPGTLPVINREAVQHVLRVGCALQGTIADYTEFDRKSYFYPDIPKGYQISQYAYPLVSGGVLHNVAITRIHLEEDTARSTHTSSGSHVDFNRAGVPLMELVTEPVIHDAETAGSFARELQLLLRTLGASEANLEKGEMRIEANVSVSKDDTFGTKVEVKNLNSFRSVERAIAYEIDRQIALIEAGGSVVQETRGWDENKQETFHQRYKEGSADYRYFPEPDLPKLIISEIPEYTREAIIASLPELPTERRKRYGTLNIKAEDIEVFLSDTYLAEILEGTIQEAGTDNDVVKLASNYLISDVVRIVRDDALEGKKEHITAQKLTSLMRMVKEEVLSSRGAKDVLQEMYITGEDPEVLAKRMNILQVNDIGALEGVIEEVIGANEAIVTEYRGGKESVLQYLVGQAMKASKGAGNPALIKEVLLKKLKG